MKAVPALIEEVTGKKPSMEVHPDEVVAFGAALQATLLQIKEGKADLVEVGSFPLVEIKDVTSHSMGVIALDVESRKDYNSIVLKKNTQIPCKVSDYFSTVTDNQTELLVEVTQGEDIDRAQVQILGETTLNIPPYPTGAPIEVFFEYDHDGIVHVTVVDLTANKELGEMHINRIANLVEHEIQEKSQKIRALPLG